MLIVTLLMFYIIIYILKLSSSLLVPYVPKLIRVLHCALHLPQDTSIRI